MKSLLVSLFVLVSSSVFSCTINEDRIQDDVFENARDLFDLTDETTIAMVEHINENTVPQKTAAAFLALQTEDRFFDRPVNPKTQPCPDRIVRIYRFYGQDEFRKCNGFMKSEVMGGVHEVLYRNCGSRSSK